MGYRAMIVSSDNITIDKWFIDKWSDSEIKQFDKAKKEPLELNKIPYSMAVRYVTMDELAESYPPKDEN